MELLTELSKNQTIALWGVIIAAITGIIVPIILHILKKKGEHIQHVDVGRINSDGTAIGDNPIITIDKRQGIDGELVLLKVMEVAEAKGRADEQIEQLKDDLEKAIERIKILEAKGSQPDAEKALEELRKNGDMRRLQNLLIKDRDVNRDALIQRNREIAAVSYLRGDTDIASEAVDEILKVLPDDIFALNQGGHIHRLRGQLKEAEYCYRRLLRLGSELSDEEVQAAALGNLGLIYSTRGELDKAEKMILKSLEKAEKIGWLELIASQYGHLGAINQMRGVLDRAEEMHQKSLEIHEQLGQLEGMATGYGNLGLIYSTRDELNKAEEMHQKSLEIHEQLGQLEGMATQYSNLGNIYLIQGVLDKAEGMYKKALKIDKKIGRLEGQAIRYLNLGTVYKQRGDTGKSKDYYEKAVRFLERIGMPHIVKEVKDWISKIDK